MPDQTKYVDPDATGNGSGDDWTNAYTSLNTWNSDAQRNLNGMDYCYCRASSGTEDTTATNVNGWSGQATNEYIKIMGETQTTTAWDTSKYRLSSTSTIPLTVTEQYTWIENLQIEDKYEDSTTYALYVSAGDVRINKCLVLCQSRSGYYKYGIYFNDGYDGNCVWNTIVDGRDSATNYARGIRYTWNCDNTEVTNCTVYGCQYGIYEASALTLCVIKNNAVFDNTDDFNGVNNADYCASDDGDGTNAQDISSDAPNYSNTFTNYGSKDVTLVVGSDCVDNGTSSPGTYDTEGDDYLGTTRSTWDIGACEYTSAGPELASMSTSMTLTQAQGGAWGTSAATSLSKTLTQAQFGTAAANGSLTLSEALTQAQTYHPIFKPVLTLTKTLTQSQSGQASASGNFSLNKTITTSDTASAVAMGALALSSTLTQSAAGQAITSASFTLSETLSLSVTGLLVQLATMTLSHTLGISQQAAAAAVGEMSLSEILTISQSGLALASASVAPSITLTQSQTSRIATSVTTSLSETFSLTQTAARIAIANLAVAQTITQSVSAEAAAHGLLNLQKTLTHGQTAQAAAYAALTLPVTLENLFKIGRYAGFLTLSQSFSDQVHGTAAASASVNFSQILTATQLAIAVAYGAVSFSKTLTDSMESLRYVFGALSLSETLTVTEAATAVATGNIEESISFGKQLAGIATANASISISQGFEFSILQQLDEAITLSISQSIALQALVTALWTEVARTSGTMTEIDSTSSAWAEVSGNTGTWTEVDD